jgi:hypothetical protein
VKTYGPAVVNVSTQGTVKTRGQMPEIPEEFQEFFRGFGGRLQPRGRRRPRRCAARAPASS